MRNFITNFRKILGICKQFAGNQVNEKGKVARCGVRHFYFTRMVAKVAAFTLLQYFTF